MIGQIAASLDDLAAFCRRRHIRRLALFGSALRDDFGPASDIDVLAEFDPAFRYTFKDLDAMESELAAIFGLPVDLIDRQALEDSPNYIRRRAILDSSVVIYAQE